MGMDFDGICVVMVSIVYFGLVYDVCLAMDYGVYRDMGYGVCNGLNREMGYNTTKRSSIMSIQVIDVMGIDFDGTCVVMVFCLICSA